MRRRSPAATATAALGSSIARSCGPQHRSPAARIALTPPPVMRGKLANEIALRGTDVTDDQIDLAQRPLTGVRVLDLTHGMAGRAGHDAARRLRRRRRDGRAPPATACCGAAAATRCGTAASAASSLDLARPRPARRCWSAGRRRRRDRARTTGPARWPSCGLGYDDVGAGNDAVVYCSISGLRPGRPRRDRPGYDAAVAAHLGIMNEWGGTATARSSSATRPSTTAPRFWPSSARWPRLRGRMCTGRGDHVDVSLRDGALALLPDELVDRDRQIAFDRSEVPHGRPRLRPHAAAARACTTAPTAADPGPHRRRRRLRPGDGGLRARRRDLQDARAPCRCRAC